MEALTWPVSIAAVLLLLGAFALLLLRAPLVRLLDRTSSAGRDGVTFGAAQERAQEAQQSKDTPALPAPQAGAKVALDFTGWPMTASAILRERSIREDLDRFTGATSDEKITALVRLLAISRLENEYMNDAWLIAGSQLELLRQLVATPDSVTVKAAEAVFDQAVTAYPSRWEGASFDVWLGWLVRAGLVEKVEDRVRITQYGRDFLKYLVDSHLAFARNG